MTDNPLPQASLRDIFFVLFKWKWSILTIVFVSVVSATAYLMLIRDDFYVAEAKLLVKLGAEQAPPSTLTRQPAVIGYRSADVNSEIDILTSSVLLVRLIDKLHMDQPGPPPPVPEKIIPKIRHYAKRAVKYVKDLKEEILIKVGLRPRLSEREKVLAQLQQTLNVESRPESNVIVAALALPFRENAGFVLNQLLEEYLAFRKEIYTDEGDDFFRGAIQESAKKLAGAERSLHAFEAKHNISVQLKQKELLLEQIAQTEHLLHLSLVDYTEAKSKVERLEAELAQSEPNLGSLGVIRDQSFQQRLLEQLADIERQHRQLLLYELETSDKVRNNREQFAAMADILAANMRSTLAEKKQIYEARFGEVESLKQQLGELHENEGVWNALRRQVDNEESEYLFYRGRLEESVAAVSATRQQRRGNVAIIESALDPLQPAGPRKTLMLGLALFAAFFAAAAFVAVAEYFDHTIHTNDELERALGAPVLAAVPILKRHTVAPPALSPPPDPGQPLGARAAAAGQAR